MVGQMGTAGVQAGGQIESGEAEKNVDYANAYNSRTAATTEETTAAANAAQMDNRTARVLGQAQATGAASGVSGGSPLAVMHDIATQGALSKQLTLWNGRNRARNLMEGAAIDTAQGQQAEQAGDIAGGVTVLTAAEKAAQQALMAGGGGG